MSLLSFTPDDGEVVFMITFDRFDCEDFFRGTGRWGYRWTVLLDSGETFSGTDLWSSTTTQDNPEGLGSMLGSFLSFFAAFIEAGEDGDNADLFPKDLRPLADALDVGQVSQWADEVRRTI